MNSIFYSFLSFVLMLCIIPSGNAQVITEEDFPQEYFTGPPVFGVPPEIDPENKLIKLGYLNVTLYGAIPDDDIDDTKEIQQAIFDSYLYSLAVYFPSGTYNVSNTLMCMTPLLINGVEKSMSNIRPAHVLVGSTKGSRPVIKLDDNCQGFDDPSVPSYNTSENPLRVTKHTSLKPVICFWRQAAENEGIEEPEANRGTKNFNQAIRGLDIDLGSGNSGAVGLWMQGAEGTQCQDMRIYAHGAFAGMFDMPGSGGSITNLEVYGGKYGIYAYIMRPIPVVTGLKLIDQSKASFYAGNFTPITFVGCKFRRANAPIFAFRNQQHPCQGNLSLIDGSIELTEGGNTSSLINNGSEDNKERILYLKNVYVKGAGSVIHNTVGKTKLNVADHTRWTKIEEYQYNRNYSIPIKLVEGETRTQTTFFNGKLTNNTVTANKAEDPPADLRRKHFWDEGFACFDHDTANILNVQDFGATPGDDTDDAAAFNNAIDSAQKCNPVKRVFIPRGHYIIRNTIHLKKDVKMFGVGRHLSILQTKQWIESSETPVISTENKAEANCAIAGFKIVLYYSQYHIYAIDWKAGRNSIVKDVWVFWQGWSEPGVHDEELPIRRVQITGNGGGKWYNHIGHVGAGSKNPGSRHVLIKGTNQPLTFYGFHIQYLKTLDNPMADIINASNVNIYSIKAETVNERISLPEGKWNYSLRIKNSKDMNVIGMSGIAQTETGKGLIEIIDPTRVTIVNLGTWVNNTEYSLNSWYYVKENFGGEVSAIPMTVKLMGLYKSGFSRRILNVPGQFSTLVPAMNAIKSDTLVTEGTINVAPGEYTEDATFSAEVDRNLLIHVNGSGADTTWIKGSATESDKANLRLMHASTSTTGKLELDFKDISFKNFGFEQSLDNEGGLLKSVKATTVLSFLNSNFMNISATRGAIIHQSASSSEIQFENCFFGENLSGSDNDNLTRGLMDIQSGSLKVNHSTFMSNFKNLVEENVPERNYEGNSSCIAACNKTGPASVNLSDNVFINNKTLEGELIQAVIAAFRWQKNNDPINLSMSGNIMIGNTRSGYPNDVDISLENDFISLSGDDNLINKLLIHDQMQPSSSVFTMDSTLEYTGDTIEFVMEGKLPDLFKDAQGVYYTQYEFFKPTLAAVTTADITDITHNSAVSGGIITDNGHDAITGSGVCWSTDPMPTVEEYFTEDTAESGEFTSNITGLETETRYYVRAYVTNSAGTAFGTELSFETKEAPVSGIETHHDSLELFIYYSGENLITENLKINQRVMVYSITGALVFDKIAHSRRMVISLPKGIYVVKSGLITKKAVVL